MRFLVFVCLSVILYVVFGLSVYVSHRFLFLCLGKAVPPDYGVSLVSSLIFRINMVN